VRLLERRLVASAARIVVVSERMKQWAVGRYALADDRVAVIPNGFSPRDRDAFRAAPRGRNGRMTMLYAGTFQRERRPGPLLGAVRLLLDAGKISPDRLRVVLVSNAARSVAESLGLGDVVECLPMAPREEVLRRYAQSDVLLLICDKSPYQQASYPGKVFEYLMTERPILALVDKTSDLGAMLAQSRLAVLADPEHIGEIASAIEHLHGLWSSGRLEVRPNRRLIERFNRRRLVERLAGTLEEAS
jgi:glycosyltransferase involved in cell wall biosynthesis